MEKIKKVLNRGISSVWAVIIVVIAILLVTGFFVYGYLWALEQSENTTPGKAQEVSPQVQNTQFDDTQTRYSIKNLRSKIEVYVSMLSVNEFLNYGYEGISCDTDEIITTACREVKTLANKDPVIKTSKNAYCIYIKLLNGNYFCLDSRSGFESETSTDPASTGYCTGTTFICPEKSFKEIISSSSLYSNLLRSELVKNGWVPVSPNYYQTGETPISPKYPEISHCGTGKDAICTIDFEKNNQKAHLNIVNKDNDWVIVGTE